MNQGERYAYVVFFTQGPRLSDLFQGKGLRESLKIIRRRPRAVYQLAGAWMCGTLTGSQHRHCLVSDDEVVMDFGFKEVTFIPVSRLERRRHNINGYVMFYSNMKPNWEQFEGIETSLAYATWGRILMGLTRGRIQCKNCTTVTRHFLECMGIRVPRRCWNPKLLLLWMTENGFTFTACRSADDISSAG